MMPLDSVNLLTQAVVVTFKFKEHLDGFARGIKS